MEERIRLDLKKDEILLLQYLIKEHHGKYPYRWMREIEQRAKWELEEAYRKPRMSREEFDALIEAERKLWEDVDSPRVVEGMCEAERFELNFNYDVEEGEDGTE